MSYNTSVAYITQVYYNIKHCVLKCENRTEWQSIHILFIPRYMILYRLAFEGVWNARAPFARVWFLRNDIGHAIKSDFG